jgi:hypothetical protein
MTLLLPATYEAVAHRDRRPGEGYFKAVRNRSEEQNVIMIEAQRHSPTLRYVSWTVVALIPVLILTIALSPVELEWSWLIASLFAGGLIVELVYRLARAGRFTGHWERILARHFRLLGGVVDTSKPPGEHEHDGSRSMRGQPPA